MITLSTNYDFCFEQPSKQIINTSEKSKGVVNNKNQNFRLLCPQIMTMVQKL